MITEYRKSVLIYCAAKMYKLNDLILHAKNNMRSFNKELSIFNILSFAKKVYLKLSADKIWFSDYLKKKLETTFKMNETLFTKKSFLDCIENVMIFDKVLVKSIVKIYTDKIVNVIHKKKKVFWETSQIIQKVNSVSEFKIKNSAEVKSTLVSKHQYSIKSELAVESIFTNTYISELCLKKSVSVKAKSAKADEIKKTTASQKKFSMKESVAKSIVKLTFSNNTFKTLKTFSELIVKFKLKIKSELVTSENSEKLTIYEVITFEESSVFEKHIFETSTFCEEFFMNELWNISKELKKQKKKKKTQHYWSIVELVAELKSLICELSTNCFSTLTDFESNYNLIIKYIAKAESMCNSEIKLSTEVKSAFKSEIKNSVCIFWVKHLLNKDM